MMKRCHIVVVLVAAAQTTSALASEWWLVDWGGNKPRRTVFFVDKAGVRRVGTHLQAWETSYYETAKTNGGRFEKQLLEFDCEARTSALVSWITYNSAGDSIDSATIPSYSRQPKPAAPDTIGDSEVNFVCGDASKAIKIDNFDPVISGRLVLTVADQPATR